MKLKSETEIKEMLDHCVKSDGQVSPTVLETLEWVLSIGDKIIQDSTFNLTNGVKNDT